MPKLLGFDSHCVINLLMKECSIFKLEKAGEEDYEMRLLIVVKGESEAREFEGALTRILLQAMKPFYKKWEQEREAGLKSLRQAGINI